MTIESDVRAAYDATDWSAGPERVYAILAALLLDHCPVPLSGARLLDAGAGTGVVGDVARARGADVVAVDLSVAMLRRAHAMRVAGSVTRLPLRDSAFDVAAAGFCLNHVPDAAAALAELRRVVRPGGAVVASVFASGDDHPAKDVVDSELAALGWVRPGWYARLKDDFTLALGDGDRLASCARDAGLAGVSASVVAPDEAVEDAAAIVGWRLGMAHTAPFVAALPAGVAASLRERLVAAVGALGQPLRPRVVVLSSRRA